MLRLEFWSVRLFGFNFDNLLAVLAWKIPFNKYLLSYFYNRYVIYLILNNYYNHKSNCFNLIIYLYACIVLLWSTIQIIMLQYFFYAEFETGTNIPASQNKHWFTLSDIKISSYLIIVTNLTKTQILVCLCNLIYKFIFFLKDTCRSIF